MTDDVNNNNIDLFEVRTFVSMDEIRNLKGFKDDNPVNKKNYDRILGDYLFSDEVRCCREKPNGQLCREGHKWGFVARLKDGSISIVGNYCARDKFGAHAKIKADRSKYLNVKKRRDKFSRLENLLADKAKILTKLDSLGDKIKTIQERINEFSNSLGPQTLRRLIDISRSGNTAIFVNVVTYNEHVEEDGEKQRERRVSPARIGFLSGVSIFNEYNFQSIYTSMRTIKLSYKKAEAITEDIKTSDLESLMRSMQDINRVNRDFQKIANNEITFFSNDLSLLCYLVDDKSDRYKTARAVLEWAGESVSNDKAKNWIIELDQRMKIALNADKIEVQH